MNETLATKLEALADKMITLVDQGINFTLAQAPGVIQELIWRERILYTVFTALYIIAIIAVTRAWRRGCKDGLWDPGPDAPTTRLLYAVIWTIIVIVLSGIYSTTSAFSRTITAWVAPRLHALEYLRRF